MSISTGLPPRPFDFRVIRLSCGASGFSCGRRDRAMFQLDCDGNAVVPRDASVAVPPASEPFLLWWMTSSDALYEAMAS